MILNSNMQIFELHHEIQFNGQIYYELKDHDKSCCLNVPPPPWMIITVSTLWRDIYRWHIRCSRIPAQSWFWQLSSRCMSDPLSDSPTCSWYDWQEDFCCSCACCHYSSRISRQKKIENFISFSDEKNFPILFFDFFMKVFFFVISPMNVMLIL